MTHLKEIDIAARSLLALVYIASFCLPVASPKLGAAVPGWFVFFTGWLGVLAFQFAWFGNILLLCTLFLSPKTFIGGISQALLFVLFFLLALTWHTLPTENGGQPITAYGLGYYLWLVDMLLGAVFCLIHASFSNNWIKQRSAQITG